MTNANEQLIAALAESESSGPRPQVAQGNPTVSGLRAELDTLLTALREPASDTRFADESACRNATDMVQAIGRDPLDASEQTIDTKTSAAVHPAASAETPLGNLGVYELLTKLGEGGMGAVYKARHTKLDKIVAIKVLPAERMKDRGAVARFEREMRAVGKLEHPNIVRAMDAGEAGGMHFLVMEYVQGVDLSQLVKQRHPLAIADACELIRQAAVGLEEARDNGMVHRDIKPSNLMFCIVGKKKPPVVKVLDMGLALLSEAYSPDAKGLTNTGQMMGTIDYMAPEQGGDSHEVDIRADIYSLGASLYKLLCGEVIYAGEKFQTPVQKMMALATQPAPPIQKRRAGVSNELAAVVHRMLEKHPDMRFDTPEEVVQALTPFCAGANLAALASSVGFDVAPAKDASSSATQPSFSQPEGDTGVSKSMPKPAAAAASAHGKPPVAANDKSNPALAKPPAPKPSAAPPAAGKRSVVPVGQAEAQVAQSTLKTNAGRKLPPRLLLAIGGGLLGFGGIAALAAAMVFFFQTPNGTLRVEINDPSIEVTVKGTDIVLQQADKEKITLTPGEHALVVKRGDFTFETDKLVLHRGETTTVTVELLAGEIKVVSDGATIGEKTLNDIRQVTSAASTTNYELEFLSETTRVEIPGLQRDRRDPITLEAQITSLNGFVAPVIAVEGKFPCALIRHGNQGLGGRDEHGMEIRPGHGVRGLLLSQPIHVALVLDAESARLYRDGKLIVSKRGRGAAEARASAKQGTWLGGGRFAGRLDEIRISRGARYDKEFTPSQRFAADADTLALYHCDEGQGDVLFDSSGHGYDGRIVGAKWIRGAREVEETNFNDQAAVARWLLENKKLANIGFDVDGQVQSLSAVPTGPCKVRELSFHFANNGGNLLVEDIPRLAVFADLERLEIVHLPMTDADLAGLAHLKKLKRLALYATELTPASAKTMREFPLLQSLQCPADDDWLRTLAGMPSIRSLTFYRTVVSPEAMKWFKEYPNLTQLEFHDAGTQTPESLAHLKDCPRLSSLKLGDEGIDDRFVDAISSMKRLTELAVESTKITEAGAKKIAAALPACKITWTGGVIPPTAPPQATGAALRCTEPGGVQVPTLKLPEKGPVTLEAYCTLLEGKATASNVVIGPRYQFSLVFGRHPSGRMGDVFIAFGKGANSAGVANQYGHATMPTAPVVGQEYHVAAVRTSDEFQLFVGGKKIATSPAVTSPYGAVFTIGDGCPVDLREIRVSKVARYDQDFTPAARFEPDADTLALYHCDEGEGEVLRDASGNSHHGRITGAKWVTASDAQSSSSGTVATPASSGIVRAADGAIDLLPLIDLVVDAGGEGGRREGSEVIIGHRATLTLPVSMAGSYQLRTEFTVSAGPKILSVLCPIAGKAPSVILSESDNESGFAGCGISGIDGLPAIDTRNPTHNPEQLVVADKRQSLELTASSAGDQATIRATLDGKPLADWTGAASRLNAGGEGKTQIVFGSYKGMLRLHTLELTMIDGEAKLLRP